MRTYSQELKDSLMAKMLAPHNLGVPQLARESGIPRDTLYGWRRQALSTGAGAARPATPLGSWSSEAKFTAVLESASLNELELGEYCRRRGLFPEQLATWRELCRQANAVVPNKAELSERRAEREQVRQLTRELQRKDQALAETLALLVLQKNSGRCGRTPRTLPHPTTAHRDERGHRPGLCRWGPPAGGLRAGAAQPPHTAALAPGGCPHGR